MGRMLGCKARFAQGPATRSFPSIKTADRAHTVDRWCVYLSDPLRGGLPALARTSGRFFQASLKTLSNDRVSLRSRMIMRRNLGRSSDNVRCDRYYSRDRHLFRLQGCRFYSALDSCGWHCRPPPEGRFPCVGPPIHWPSAGGPLCARPQALSTPGHRHFPLPPQPTDTLARLRSRRTLLGLFFRFFRLQPAQHFGNAWVIAFIASEQTVI